MSQKHKNIPFLLLEDCNARHPIWGENCKAPNQNGKTLEDIISRHNAQIQNHQNSIYVHKIGSSRGYLVLTIGISNLKCQTKEFGSMNTCHKGIITTTQNARPLIDNKKYETKDAYSNAWKNDLTSPLNKNLKGNVTLNLKSVK